MQRNVSLPKTTVPNKKSSLNTIKKETSVSNITDKRIEKVNNNPMGIDLQQRTITARNIMDKRIEKVNNNPKVMQLRQRTNSVPKVTTPKSKENKPTIVASSISKSAKKALWKRRPKRAHSGVPFLEKTKRLLEPQLPDSYLDQSI